jgi:membrane protein
MSQNLLRRFKDEVLRAHVVNVAAAAAFWLFLALVPLAAVAGMVAAKLATTKGSLLAPLLVSMPAASRELLTKELGRVAAWNGHAVAPLSAIVFMWLASSGVHAILDAFDTATECSRPWWKKRLVALGICVLLSLAVAAIALVIGFLHLGPFTSGAPSLTMTGAARSGIVFVVEVGVVIAIFALGVMPEARRRQRLWPGALLAVVIHTLVGYGYVEYVRQVGAGGAYRAGLATIAVTMIAVFVFTLSLLLGVTLNKLLPRSRPVAARSSSRLAFR